MIQLGSSEFSESNAGIRINAFLASAGMGSRRSVEELIQDRRVRLNRRLVDEMSTRVNPLVDEVTVDGKRVQPRQRLYLAMNKPRQYACTRDDPHARRTIYDLLPREYHHLVHVGRLDADSEGLLLLSNDGDWIHSILHPKFEIQKIYEVSVEGCPETGILKAAERGVISKGERLRVESVKVIRSRKAGSVLHVTLKEGKNREIRRIFNVLKHPVQRLERIQIGTLVLKNIPKGTWRALTSREIASFRKSSS